MLLKIPGYMYLFKNRVSVFFSYIPRSGIAKSYNSFIFSFLRNLHTLFIVAAPVCIPTNRVLGFPFLHILTNICYLLSFWQDHSDRCEVIFHCGFDLHFLMVSDIEYLLLCLFSICMSALEKCLLPMFWLGCFFHIELYELFLYFGY